MTWTVRHQGSPRSIPGLTLAQVIMGLRDGLWEPTDEVMGPQDRGWVAIEAHPQLEAVAEEIEPPPPPVHLDETVLDMTSLIDVVLVLLIFFIMTAIYTFVRSTVPIQETTNAQKGAIRKVSAKTVDTFMIRVEVHLDKQTRKPVIRVENENPTSLEGFPTKLRKWVIDTKRHEMLLDIADDVSWGDTITIQDIAKESGIEKILYLVAGGP
jgi:biopolymer transport protein ExbD